MTNTFRRTPISGNTTARSEKRDKQFANRRFRVLCKNAIRLGKDPFYTLREVSNRYNFDKDGKHWWPGFLTYPYKGR